MVNCTLRYSIESHSVHYRQGEGVQSVNYLGTKSTSPNLKINPFKELYAVLNLSNAGKSVWVPTEEDSGFQFFPSRYPTKVPIITEPTPSPNSTKFIVLRDIGILIFQDFGKSVASQILMAMIGKREIKLLIVLGQNAVYAVNDFFLRSGTHLKNC